MRKQSLLVLVGLLCCGTSVRAAAVALDDRPLLGAKQTDIRPSNDAAAAPDYAVPADNGALPGVPADIEMVHLDPNMVFEHVIVGADGVVSLANDSADGVASVAGGGGTAAVGERVIYSNTLGIDGVRFGPGSLISDDIGTTAPVGCKLTKFSFKVLGKVITTDPGGAYTVNYSLYNNCPQAVTSTERLHYTEETGSNTGIKIGGTDGVVTFPDDGPRIITHTFSPKCVGGTQDGQSCFATSECPGGFCPAGSLPTNMWLGIYFTRNLCVGGTQNNQPCTTTSDCPGGGVCVAQARSNCGVVVGAPAMVGHSADNWDFPGFPCNGNLGGFPEQAHASFWTEVYGGASCSDTFLGYRASQANGPKITEGVSVPFFDDIKLIVNNCLMTGYEVAVRGQGWYTFGLYEQCRESAAYLVPGTDRFFNVGLSTKPQLQLARFTFDPPIQLTTDSLYFRFTVNNVSNGGVVMAGIQPTIGSSGENYFTIDPQSSACIPKSPPPPAPLTGVFHASITCSGDQPLGACCDPYLKQCVGGTDDGIRCSLDADCTAPGLCNPVCRQVAKINCPFPPRNQNQDPKWQLGAVCPHLCEGGPIDGQTCTADADCRVCVGGTNNHAPCTLVEDCPGGTCSGICVGGGSPGRSCTSDLECTGGGTCGGKCSTDPFGNTPCGEAACCHVTLDPVTHNLNEVCENLTERSCDQAPPIEKPRLWQLGTYCGFGSQYCPRNACLGVSGSCTAVHPGIPGCSDPNCCTKVCTIHGIDGAYCCDVEWDQDCVTFAAHDCIIRPGNDECAPDSHNRIDGAMLISVPGSGSTDNKQATSNPSDPGFCCNNGVASCVGGSRPGLPCVVQTDCPSGGFCPDRQPSPGMQGLKTVWFKFVQPPGFTTATVQTCNGSPPANDSLLQVFKAGDNSSQQNACRTLSAIGCNDDSGVTSCTGGRNSKLCVSNLVSGETYYVMVGTKTEDITTGVYRVDVSAGCTAGDVTPNDYCPFAKNVTDGVEPFSINVPIKECKGGTNAGHPCTTNTNCPGVGASCQLNPHTVTFDCPAEPCVPNGLNDLWYNYTATCTGEARFETCAPPGQTDPQTTLAVYADCTKCPLASGPPIRCNDNAYGDCGSASRVAISVQAGQCFKVRLADEQGFPASGNLTITCTTNDCQPNGIPDDVDIANCPPNNPDCHDCNGNGRPDFCDIRDAFETDCNLNRVPDSCELSPATDCQPNGILDSCDIANCHGEAFCVDLNHDGIPDICRPVTCSSVTSVTPTNCAIDARQPHAPGNPAALQGWNSVDMTFNAACVASTLTPGDFSVSCTPAGAPCPTISTVTGVGVTATINLSSVIPAGKWTCITHTASGAQICLGSLPADANSDRTAAPVDILEIIDNLNGVRVPPLTINQCDIDRSALCAPADILSEIDLLNGANGFLVWNGRNLPVCPSAP